MTSVSWKNLTLGLAAVLLPAAIYVQLWDLYRIKRRNKALRDVRRQKVIVTKNAIMITSPVQNEITLEDMKALVRSTNVKMRSRTWLILLDRIMDDPMIGELIVDLRGQDGVARKTASTIIRHLAEIDVHVDKLVELGAVEALADCLWSSDMTTLRNASIALSFIIVAEEDHIRRLLDTSAIEAICKFFVSMTEQSMNSIKDMIALTQVLSGSDAAHERLIDADIVVLTGNACTYLTGSIALQKTAMSIIVRIVSSMENNDAEEQLIKLKEGGMIKTIGFCLRSSNTDLNYWTIGLVHEFVVKDIARDELVELPGIAKVLVSYLSTLEEPGIIRIFLRSVKFLARDNSFFQEDLIEAGLIGKLLQLIKDHNSDTQYWIIQVIHEFLHMPDTARILVNEGGLEILGKSAIGASYPTVLYLAEIMVAICSLNSLADLGPDNILFDVVQFFIRSVDQDLQYAGVMILFDSSLLLESTFDKAFQPDFVEQISELMYSSGKPKLQLSAAKLLLSMSLAREEHAQYIANISVVPLIFRISGCVGRLIESNSLSDLISPVQYQFESNDTTPKNSKATSSPSISDIQVQVTPKIVLSNISEASPGDDDEMAIELISLVDSLIIFCESVDFFEEHVAINLTDSVLKPFLQLVLLSTLKLAQNVSSNAVNNITSRLNDLVNAGFAPSSSIISEINHIQARRSISSQIYKGIFACSYKCCHSLWPFSLFQEFNAGFTILESARDFLTESGFLALLCMACLEIDELKEKSFETFSRCCAEVDSEGALETRKHLLYKCDAVPLFQVIEKAYYMIQAGCAPFYLSQFISSLANRSDDADLEPDRNEVILSELDKTNRMLLTRDRREIHNYSWTFESIRATHHTPFVGKYVYEVEILSSDIIQIGWALRIANFDPENGNGVGDDQFSYSIDGCRGKKWHKDNEGSNDFGIGWRCGDIIGAAIDLDHCSISYYLNGDLLGVAFEQIVADEFYPAISLATDQSCRVTFGGPYDGLRYKYDEYVPIGLVNCLPQKHDDSPEVPSPTQFDVVSAISSGSSNTSKANDAVSYATTLVTGVSHSPPPVDQPAPKSTSLFLKYLIYFELQWMRRASFLGPPLVGLTNEKGNATIALVQCGYPLVESCLVLIRHMITDEMFFRRLLEKLLQETLPSATTNELDSNESGGDQTIVRIDKGLDRALLKLNGCKNVGFGLQDNLRLLLTVDGEPILTPDQQEQINQQLGEAGFLSLASFQSPLMFNLPRIRTNFGERPFLALAQHLSTSLDSMFETSPE